MFEQLIGDPTFTAVQTRLFGLAYRMLGSRAEAEDVVQDVYIRWHQSNHDAIENLKPGWSRPRPADPSIGYED